MNKISCNTIRDILPLYVDEVVSENTRTMVVEHLGQCAECRKQTAREVNAMSTKAVIAVGVFVGTLLSPVLGDEVAGAGALSNAWAAVKSIGLSQSALAVFQGLTMQFGYVLP